MEKAGMTLPGRVATARQAMAAATLLVVAWASGAGTAQAAADNALVVIDRITAKDGSTVPAHYVPQLELDRFTAASLAEYRQHRQLAVSAARDILRTSVRDQATEMRGRLPAFADWRYSVFTSYRLTVPALVSAVSGGDGGQAIRAVVREQFQAIVVDPEAAHARMDAAMARARDQMVVWRRRFDQSQREALDQLVSQRGGPWDGRPAGAVVTESMLLFRLLPDRGAAAGSGLEKADKTSVSFETGASVLAAEQAAPQGFFAITEPVFGPPIAGMAVGAAGWAVSSFLGVAAFTAGVAAEYLIVRSWDSADRETLLADATRILDELEAAMLQDVDRRAEALAAASFSAAAP